MGGCKHDALDHRVFRLAFAVVQRAPVTLTLYRSGMILGTRLYYSFFPEDVADEAVFQERMDSVCHEIGDRAQQVQVRTQEAVPPHRVRPATLPAAPAPPPTPTLASATPRRSKAPSPGPAASMGPSPSMQESIVLSPPDSSALIERLLEQQKQMMIEQREYMEAKLDAKDMELHTRLEQQRAQLTLAPSKAIVSDGQLAALQTRLEGMHTSKLLSPEELHAMEDLCADFLELKAVVGVVTNDMLVSHDAVAKIVKLVGLSEHILSDATFARQARRKFT